MTITELEKTIQQMRIQYVKDYYKNHGLKLYNVCDEDIIGIYACLEVKEKINK